MLGELTWEEESDGGLDLTRGESVLLVISDESSTLSGDLLEDIVDERVHDAHGSLADASLWVDLLEDSVDVDGESFTSLLLWGSLSGGFLGSASLSGSLCHFDELFKVINNLSGAMLLYECQKIKSQLRLNLNSNWLNPGESGYSESDID